MGVNSHAKVIQTIFRQRSVKQQSLSLLYSLLNSFVRDHNEWVAEGRSEADLGTTPMSHFLYQEILVN